MKFKITVHLILISLLFINGINNKITSPKVNHHIDVTGNYPNGYWNYPCAAGDTLFLHGTFTYMAFGSVNGTSNAKICIDGTDAIFKWNGIANQGAGLNFQDCNYWHIWGTTIKNAPGTAFSVSGKSNHFEFDHFLIDTCTYFGWWKDEAADHPCDSSYWRGHNTMDDFYCHDGTCHYARQDGWYLGTTNQQANRPFQCNGITYNPVGAEVSNIRVARIHCYEVQRTAFQLSGGKGKNYIDSNDISDCGFEFNYFQGNGIADGGNTQNCEIGWNKIRRTFLYNIFTQGYGNIYIHDNDCDSAGMVYHIKNSQQIPSCNLTSYKFPTTYKLYNNKFGYNSAQPYTNVVVYATTTHMTDTGNYFRCTGVFYNKGQNFTYDTICSGNNHSDTTYTTVKITHDTTIMVITLDSIKVIDSVRNNWTKLFTDGKKKGGYVTDSRTFFHYTYFNDTTYPTITTSPHDTTYITVTFLNPVYGAFILTTTTLNTLGKRLKVAKDTGCTAFRYNHFYGQQYQAKDVADSGLKCFLTYDLYSTSQQSTTHTPSYFDWDTGVFRHRVDSVFRIRAPETAGLINEVLNYGYWNPSVALYGHLYKIWIEECHLYGILSCDGGITYPDIVYSYWNYLSVNGLTSKLDSLKAWTGINTISGQFAQNKLHQSDSLYDLIKNNGADFVNWHWYEPPGSDNSKITVNKPLTLALYNYLVLRTGKKVIVTEFGTDNFDTGLLNELLDFFITLGISQEYYFAGDNSSQAINLLPTYSSYIKTH